MFSMMLAGCGIGLFSTFGVEAEIASGLLEVVLPDYRGAGKTALYAVYPCRDYLPAKVTIFLDFFGERLAGRLAERKSAASETRRPRPASLQVAAE